MQITRAAEYAIRGVLYLSSRPKGSICLLSEISERQQIPPSFLSKIFQNLARAGLVTSSRGSGGGFMLAKEPHQITLLDVLEAIEGQMQLNVCLNNGASCENVPRCAVHGVWHEAQDYMLKLLREHDFGELAATNRRLADQSLREPQPSD
jgi:Rrf2 family protein